MKIIVSQQDKKINISFKDKKMEESFVVAKADEFLICVDKLLKKHHTVKISGFRDAKLEFHNSGLLTERVIRSIILGLSFSQN